MANAPKVLAFAGSLRVGSYNKMLVKIAAAGAKAAGAEVTLIDLRDFPLPVFDEDLEAAEGLPENGRKLKDLFLANQGLLLSCPEYNSSISAVLKNTIDWVSRPVKGQAGLAEFDGKVASLMAASPGAFGGMRGLTTVRSILGNIKVIVLPEQMAVSKANDAFNPDGTLKDAKQQEQAMRLGANVANVVRKLYGG